jgi:hypothetical protein
VNRQPAIVATSASASNIEHLELRMTMFPVNRRTAHSGSEASAARPRSCVNQPEPLQAAQRGRAYKIVSARRGVTMRIIGSFCRP